MPGNLSTLTASLQHNLEGKINTWVTSCLKDLRKRLYVFVLFQSMISVRFWRVTFKATNNAAIHFISLVFPLHLCSLVPPKCNVSASKLFASKWLMGVMPTPYRTCSLVKWMFNKWIIKCSVPTSVWKVSGQNLHDKYGKNNGWPFSICTRATYVIKWTTNCETKSVLPQDEIFRFWTV